MNNPTENSPILITTNFALTYFIVSGEIEDSNVPVVPVGHRHRRSVSDDRLGCGKICR